MRPALPYLFAGIPFVIILLLITSSPMGGKYSLLSSGRVGSSQCALLEARVSELESQLAHLKGHSKLSGGVGSACGVQVTPFCDAQARMLNDIVQETLHFGPNDLNYKSILDDKVAGPLEYQLMNDPRWWCDKLDPAENGLRKYHYKRGNTDELVVGVLGGNNVAHSRATSARDSWLQRVEHHTIFTVHEDPSIPSVGLFDYYGDEFKGRIGYEAGTGGKSPMGEKNWLGARYMYEKYPDKSWYLIANDDQWTNVDELMRELEKYPNPKSTPYWLCPKIFPYTFNDGDTNFEYLLKVGEDHFGDTWKWGNGDDGQKKKFAWTSGGFGVLISNPVMKAMVGNINKFRDALPGQTFDHGNDVETGACLTFLGFEPIDFKTNFGAFAHAADCWDVPWTRAHPGMLSGHYMWPFKTMSIEQWTVHRNVEAMARDGQLQDLVDYLVEFVDDHFEIMRRRMTDVRYAHEMQRNTSLYTKNWFDIPSLLRPPPGKGTPESEEIVGQRIKKLKRDRWSKYK